MTTTTTVLPPPVQQKFNAKLLSTPQARLIHGAFATPYEMEERSGNILRLRRYSRLNTAPVPLGPAMNNPPLQTLNAVDLDAKIDWYATYLIVTKEVTLINQDPVLNELAARLGQSMRETEDELIRDMLRGTASVINCTSGTNGDNPSEITLADIENVVQALQNSDCDYITNMIGAEDKFGTGPVLDAYFALGHTNLGTQLRNVNGFLNKAQYPNQVGVLPSEFGSVTNTRMYLSSRGSITTNGSLLGADIYNLFIGGQESYAKIEQNGVSSAFIYHPPGHGDDPAELRQTGAWRMAQVPKPINSGNYKPTLIDLEAYGKSYGDRGEDFDHAERLNVMAA